MGKRFQFRLLSWGLIAAVAALLPLASAWGGSEKVRVYTNADLGKPLALTGPTFTNADLARPARGLEGAYTNADLERLAPPAAALTNRDLAALPKDESWYTIGVEPSAEATGDQAGAERLAALTELQQQLDWQRSLRDARQRLRDAEQRLGDVIRSFRPKGSAFAEDAVRADRLHMATVTDVVNPRHVAIREAEREVWAARIAYDRLLAGL